MFDVGFTQRSDAEESPNGFTIWFFVTKRDYGIHRIARIRLSALFSQRTLRGRSVRLTFGPSRPLEIPDSLLARFQAGAGYGVRPFL
jgi:hypothetical protein